MRTAKQVKTLGRFILSAAMLATSSMSMSSLAATAGKPVAMALSKGAGPCVPASADDHHCDAMEKAHLEMVGVKKEFAKQLPDLIKTPRAAIAAFVLLHPYEELAPEQRQWMLKARTDGNNDALVQSILATESIVSKGTRLMDERAMRRVVELDPDNAFGWMLDYYIALRDKDQDRMTMALKKIGAAKRYDDYSQPLYKELIALAAKTPWTDAQKKQHMQRIGFGTPEFAHVNRYMGALWKPGFGVLNSGCLQPKGEALEQCKALGDLLYADNRKLANQKYGETLLLRLETDPLRRAQLQSAQRTRQWQLGELKRASKSAPGRDPLVRTQKDLDNLISNGEQAAIRRALAREGISEQPPKDWMPKKAKGKQLPPQPVPSVPAAH